MDTHSVEQAEELLVAGRYPFTISSQNSAEIKVFQWKILVLLPHFEILNVEWDLCLSLSKENCVIFNSIVAFSRKIEVYVHQKLVLHSYVQFSIHLHFFFFFSVQDVVKIGK